MRRTVARYADSSVNAGENHAARALTMGNPIRPLSATTARRNGSPPEPECKSAFAITDRVISGASVSACYSCPQWRKPVRAERQHGRLRVWRKIPGGGIGCERDVPFFRREPSGSATSIVGHSELLGRGLGHSDRTAAGPSDRQCVEQLQQRSATGRIGIEVPARIVALILGVSPQGNAPRLSPRTHRR